MPGFVQAGGQNYLVIFPLSLFLFRSIGERDAKCNVLPLIKQSHRKLQAPSHGFAHCTEPRQQAFCDTVKYICIKERLCSRH